MEHEANDSINFPCFLYVKFYTLLSLSFYGKKYIYNVAFVTVVVE